MQRAAATTRAATALLLEFCGMQGISGVLPLALQCLSMAGEQIPSMGLGQCLNPRVVAAAAAAWQPDPRTSLESHPCTSHYNPHPSCLQAPDVPASLAPCLAMARKCPREFCLIPSRCLAWKLAGCKHFCHCSKTWDFSFSVKQFVFFLEGLKR